MAAPAKTKVKTSDFDAEPARDATLFLIDGSSLAYRSFFALPQEIATADGRPTNALLGFSNMLVKLIADFDPQTVIVAWDVGGETKRKQAYAEYKSQRPPMPDLLSQQWPLFRPLVDAFGFTNISMQEYEADDVIGTLSAQAETRGIKTCIVTYDRDAMQLVSDQTVVMMTSKGVSDVAVFTPERVRERYGVKPAQIADFIALRGDTSDNIPGIPGIGDKTAADLLREYGTLATVLDSIDRISGAKRKQNLAEFGDQSRMSMQLATIVRDLPLEIDLEAVHAEAPDRSKLNEMFQEFEFRTLARRVAELELSGPASGGHAKVDGASGGTAPAKAEPATGELIAGRNVSPQELGSILAASRAHGAFGPSVPVVVRPMEDGSVIAAARIGERMPDAPDVDQQAPEWIAVLRCSPAALGAALAGSQLTTFDWKGLPREVLWKGDAVEPAVGLVDDLRLASYLLQPGRRTFLLGELQGELGLSVRLQFACDDVDLVEVARQAALLPSYGTELSSRLEAQGMLSLYRDIELPLVPVLAAMERLGIRIDEYRMGEIAAKVSDQLDELVDRAHELAGEDFGLGSPKQLAVILFEKLGLPAQRKGKTGYSTDARVLRDLRDLHPIIAVIEQWRELSKLKGTYLDALPVLMNERTGRIHTTFSQVTAATGRLSSINPNLQNIPVRTPVGREIRSAFVPEEGWRFVAIDYSQVELRLLAHVSKEPRLVEAFKRGDDVHRITAAEVAGIEPSAVTREQRSAAKAINFGIIYGISSYGLAAQLGISREEAQTYIELYLGRYPMVSDFIERTIAAAGELGYVTTLFGRRRPIPELKSRSFQTRQLGERLAVNTILQGTAADILKVAMITAARELREAGLQARIVLQIHDELLLECPEGEVSRVKDVVQRAMVGAFDMSPPLAVEHGVGENWLDAK